ncbi:hypothetical protein ACR79N_03275 [Sphingobacterium siyangense]|uniref:T9SS C-terminal target domain-containing protein n=1 Tax=Sphingobacterium siyangense TaxID=459529 RepID=A0A562MQJ3_9SPHI|nr:MULTISPECIES: hypothetical protein [Sphingobacterium]TWI22110.1 hypothetical protein IQ31_01514 [Sphingobacterium siyangense]
MKKRFLFFSLAALLFAGACKETTITDEGGGTETPTNPENQNVVEISGEITSNTTWTSDKIYVLKGFVYVSNGATLTIEPGTIIKGDKASKATLTITRGAKINATGTADKPIVFTSNLAAGARSQGDWGGVILLGKAPVNQGTDVKIEGGLAGPTGKDEKNYIYYGGTDAADNSGTLKYVRIEFAGIAYSVDNEINGLTLGGVGNGTTLEYIQVYRSGDDAFEWFGGTVNAKHLLAVGTWDDDFDTDFGYSGNVQFALAQRVPTVADQSGSNGYESDNNATGTVQTPKTSAVFSNVTVLGPIQKAGGSFNANYQHGAQIRRNSSISILNSVISGFPLAGLYIDDTKVAVANSTSNNFLTGSAVFENNLVYGSKDADLKVSSTDNAAAISTLIRAKNVFDNSKYASELFVAPYNFGSDFSNTGATPDFKVLSGSAAASGAIFTNAKVSGSFFEKVAYKGAFGTTDWTSGWAHYDPQNLAYTTPGQVK